MDVEFLLTLVRDPLARQKLDQWEKDILRAQKNVTDRKLKDEKRHTEDINRLRGLETQREIQELRRQEQEGRAALQRRLTDYKAKKREEVAATKRAEQEKRQAEKAAERERLLAMARERRELEATSAVMRRMAQLARQRAMAGGGFGGGGDSGGGMLGSMLAGAAGGGRLSGVASMAMRFAGPAAVLAGGYGAVNQYSQFESNRLQMGAMFGSDRAADTLIDQFRKLGEFGIDMGMLNQVATMMGGFGMSAEEVGKKLQELAVITGGNSDRLGRLAVQYAQMHSLGTLYTEDMKIMAEAGFNPLTQMVKDTGQTMAQLRERMEEGEISAEMVSEAFTRAAASSNRLAVMQGSAMQTFGEASSEVSQLMIAIGKKIWETRIPEGLSAATAYTASNLRTGIEGGSWFNYGSPTESAVAAWTGYMNRGGDVLGVTSNKDLDAGIRQHQARLRASEEAAAAEREAAAAAKVITVEQAKQVENAYKISEIRGKSIDKEVKGRERVLDLVNQEFDRARDALVSARERFGGMTPEEQARTLDIVQRARRGTKDLTLEEINVLKGLGTKESSRLASQALVYRSTAEFGSEKEEQLKRLRDREAEIRAEQQSLEFLNRGRDLRDWDVGDLVRRRELSADLEGVIGRQNRVHDRFRDRSRMVESLFSEEKGEFMSARQKRIDLDAKIENQIEFVAKFEDNARKVGEQVMDLFKKATDQHNEEVMKILKPLVENMRKQRQRDMANAPGRRF